VQARQTRLSGSFYPCLAAEPVFWRGLSTFWQSLGDVDDPQRP
jgi:hypothetical protein